MKPLALDNKKPVVKTKLKVLSGPLKGKSFKLISDQIYIGRAAEVNDVVLSYDPYCSRKHALLTSSRGRYILQKLSENPHLFINKKPVKKPSSLRNGDIITIGQTELQLEILKKAELAVIKPNTPALNQIPQEEEKVAKKSNLPRIVIILLFILGGFFFLTDSDKQDAKKKNQIDLRTQQELEDDITSLNQKTTELKKEKENLKNPAYNNAQIAYLKGVRDFRKGYYGRAIENFRTCKTLYPQHRLCNSYLEKSQVKYEQLAQNNLVLGQRYKKNKQYKQCMGSFKTVMKMMSHQLNHPLYKEALNSYNFCELQLQDRY